MSRTERSVISGARSRQHTEIVIVRRDDSTEAREGQEEADYRISHGCSVAIQAAPLGGGREGKHREEEEDEADADADRCEHGPSHLGLLVRGNVGFLRWKTARGGSGLARRDLRVLVVLP